MKKIIILIILLAVSSVGYLYREKIKTFVENKFNNRETQIIKVERSHPLEVETFNLGKDAASLTFTKSAMTSPSLSVNISPEIAGKITSVKVKVGDKVQKNQTLITLGDSLSTNISNAQLDALNQASDIIDRTKFLNDQFFRENVLSAQMGVISAKKAYKNTIITKENTEAIIDKQIESAELAIETSEQAYENAVESQNDLEDILDDLEDDLDDLEDSDSAESAAAAGALEKSISQTEAQLTAAENAKDMAKAQIKQSKLALEQLEETSNAQMDQLSYAIQQAFIQYKSSIKQFESAVTGLDMQDAGVDSQAVQTQSALNIAEITKSYQNVKSPITGTVIEIYAKEGNIAAPGQVLVKVENFDEISVKTSVNEKEAEFISVGDIVEIVSDRTLAGEIVSISPAPNAMTQKIDVEIRIKNPQGLSSNTFVNVKFTAVPIGGIFIPLESVFLDNDKKFVQIVGAKNAVKYVEITTGEIIDTFIEVVSGLTGTEKIITTKAKLLQEGDKVTTL